MPMNDKIPPRSYKLIDELVKPENGWIKNIILPATDIGWAHMDQGQLQRAAFLSGWNAALLALKAWKEEEVNPDETTDTEAGPDDYKYRVLPTDFDVHSQQLGPGWLDPGEPE